MATIGAMHRDSHSEATVNTIQDTELPNIPLQFEQAFLYAPLSAYIWYCELHTKLA